MRLRPRKCCQSIEIQSKGFFQSAAYSVGRLDSDVESLKTLFQSRGYLNAKITPFIETVDKGRKLGITYLCEAGVQARTQSLTISGNAGLATARIDEAYRAGSGETLFPRAG